MQFPSGSPRSMRDRVQQLLPSVRTLLMAETVLTAIMVGAAVDGITIGPGPLVIVELGQPALVALAASNLGPLAAMLLLVGFTRARRAHQNMQQRQKGRSPR